MDRFQEMQVFVRIAERSSFTRAADDLQMPRATVTNLMQRMEQRLGARLLERTTRTVKLSPDGQAYYQRCLRLLADLEETEGAFRNTAPKGLLRVNLQGTLARHFVIPALADFVMRYPQIELHISEDDRLIDLVREGVDCVLRAGSLADSAMVARRIAEMQQVTCASPAYLTQFGEPHDMECLAEHTAVNYLSSQTGNAVPLEFMIDGQVISHQLKSRITVTGADLYTGSAVAGLGLIQVPRYRILKELREKRLKIILSKFPPPVLPVSVLYPQRRQLSSRVRVFADWLQEIFAASA